MSIPERLSAKLEVKNPSKVHRTPALAIPAPLSFLVSSVFIFLLGLRLGRRADIIVAQHHPHHLVASVAILLGRLLNIPVVVRADDTLRDTGQKWRLGQLIKVLNTINENLFAHADRLLLVTSESKSRLRNRLRGKLPAHKLITSPNGVNLAEFDRVSTDRWQIRKALGIRQDEKVLLFAGHYARPDYGIEVVLRALPSIMSEIPEVVLVLAGDTLTPSQNRLINSLGVQANVRAYGAMPRDQMIDFMIAADLCIGPLYAHLAMPLKILEYMACGKPTVTGLQSLTNDLAAPNRNCVIVSPNSKAVAAAVVNILRDSRFSAMLGSNARQSAEKYTWDRIVDGLETILLDSERRSRSTEHFAEAHA